MLTLLMTTITNNTDKITLIIGKVTAVFEVLFIAVKLLKVFLKSVLAGISNTQSRFARFINGLYKGLTYFERNADKTVKEINDHNKRRLTDGKDGVKTTIEHNDEDDDESADEDDEPPEMGLTNEEV